MYLANMIDCVYINILDALYTLEAFVWIVIPCRRGYKFVDEHPSFLSVHDVGQLSNHLYGLSMFNSNHGINIS